MSLETNLMDTYSREAQRQAEEAAHPREVEPPAPRRELPLSMEIAGLTPQRVGELLADHPVRPEDKQRPPAALNGRVLTVWIAVTPEMARRWMRSNFRNRPVSDDTVACYAREMAAGRWTATHQGIAFNDRDQLIDGQHRLLAVMQAKRTVRMMVTFGLPSAVAGAEMTVMDCVDRGRSRSVADQLKIQHGLAAGTAIAQIATGLAFLCVGERIRRLSVGQSLDIYRAFQSGVDFVIANRAREHTLRSAGVLAAFAFAHPIAPDEVRARYQRLMTGKQIERSPMLGALRSFLTGENAKLLIKSINRGVAELVTHAIWTDLESAEGGARSAELAKDPAEWAKAVLHFRGQQVDRVKKIAGMFQV